MNPSKVIRKYSVEFETTLSSEDPDIDLNKVKITTKVLNVSAFEKVEDIEDKSDFDRDMAKDLIKKLVYPDEFNKFIELLHKQSARNTVDQSKTNRFIERSRREVAMKSTELETKWENIDKEMDSDSSPSPPPPQTPIRESKKFEVKSDSSDQRKILKALYHGKIKKPKKKVKGSISDIKTVKLKKSKGSSSSNSDFTSL
ncbi:unnamed protein product [Candida verbasci]|uniref:Uncharacterized protein n=1 Tax=Candida verbasci TaxID=1227364 RepID=A0A9W4XBZ6_9ASCO|nr:unnamed protein product [Candida verbasci]